MNVTDMLVKHFLLDKLQTTLLALNPLAIMYQLHMTIQMMFVTKTHDAVSAFETFYVAVWDHVSFEMWASFEGFVAVFLFACVGPDFCMAFGHVTVEMA